MAYVLSPRVKFKEVTGQFLVGDIVATIATVLVGVLVQRVTGSVGWAAIAAATTEGVVWYLYLLLYYVFAKNDPWTTAWRHLLSDFGFAEVLDSFVVRPGLMYIFPILIHNEGAGIFIAKIIADTVYTWIGLYRQRKRTLPRA